MNTAIDLLAHVEAAGGIAEVRGETQAEIGGPKGLEPTRYGDWENSGRCIDF